MIERHELVPDVLRQVELEIERVHEKRGEQDCTPSEWHVILSEEVGEVAREINDTFRDAPDLDRYVAELIQVAAMAVTAACGALYDDQARWKSERERNVYGALEVFEHVRHWPDLQDPRSGPYDVQEG